MVQVFLLNMATGTIKDIINVYNPTLGSHPRLDDYITLTKPYVSSCVFGSKFYNQAVALLVLHQLALADIGDGSESDPNVNSSNIVTEKEGDLSRSFGGLIFVGDTSYDYLKTTDYGRQFNFLRKKVRMTFGNRLSFNCRTVI